jgi:excinuclease ABC subunit C
MRELKVESIPTFGLAKEFEEIYMEHRDEPIILDRNSDALHLIQRIRDEAHRFAITYHRSLRGKYTLKSLLEEIPGIGPKRRQALYKKFGSIMSIQEATTEQLRDVEGMNQRAAENIIEFFNQKEQ